MLVLIDGNFRLLLPAKSPSISVQRSKNMSSFVRFNQDFYRRLETRLLFKGTA